MELNMLEVAEVTADRRGIIVKIVRKTSRRGRVRTLALILRTTETSSRTVFVRSLKGDDRIAAQRLLVTGLRGCVATLNKLALNRHPSWLTIADCDRIAAALEQQDSVETAALLAATS